MRAIYAAILFILAMMIVVEVSADEGRGPSVGRGPADTDCMTFAAIAAVAAPDGYEEPQFLQNVEHIRRAVQYYNDIPPVSTMHANLVFISRNKDGKRAMIGYGIGGRVCATTLLIGKRALEEFFDYLKQERV